MTLFIFSCVFMLAICLMAYHLLMVTRLTLKKTHEGFQVIVKRKLLGIINTKTDVVDGVVRFDYKEYESDDTTLYSLIAYTSSGEIDLSNVSFQTQNKRLLKKLNNFLQQNHPIHTQQNFRLDYGSLIFSTIFMTPFVIVIFPLFLYCLFSLILSEEDIAYVQNTITDKLFLATDLVDKSTAPDYFPNDAFWIDFCELNKNYEKQYVMDGIQENQSFGKSYLSLPSVKKQMQQASQGDWRMVDLIELNTVLVLFYEKGGHELSYTFLDNGNSDVDCQVSLKKPVAE